MRAVPPVPGAADTRERLTPDQRTGLGIVSVVMLIPLPRSSVDSASPSL